MKKFKVCKLTSLLVMFMFSGAALSEQGLELQSGFGPDSDPQGYFRFLAVEHNRYPERLVTSKEGSRVYSLGRRSVGAYEVKNQSLRPIGGWPLTRWFHEFLEPEYLERLSRQYENPKDRLLIVNPNAIGCLSAAPLRYGSIDATGKDYLVLHLSNDFLLFSPDVGKVVFGANIRLADWMTRSGTITFYEDEEGVLQESEGDPQYASNIAAVSVRGGALPPRERGYRGYGKLYFGDFNNDENADILLWRKLYISRLVGDETEGFEHLGDTLIHYQLIDGEYQPQDTDEATIKGWLSANELTWQKGYPNKSECEGVEGELIPEMHDPLLNDPDVLQ